MKVLYENLKHASLYIKMCIEWNSLNLNNAQAKFEDLNMMWYDKV